MILNTGVLTITTDIVVAMKSRVLDRLWDGALRNFRFVIRSQRLV
jgi:hypothetical protein